MRHSKRRICSARDDHAGSDNRSSPASAGIPTLAFLSLKHAADRAAWGRIMRTSTIAAATLVLALAGPACAQLGLARFAASSGDDRAAIRAWKHHLDAGSRRSIAERAAIRDRTPEGTRRITLKSDAKREPPRKATITDAGVLAAPMLERNPMAGGPAGRGTSKAKKKPR